MNQTRSRNQGYTGNNSNTGNINNHQTIWSTTAQAPPAYDNIYESSLPINPLPDYNTTQIILKEQQILKTNNMPSTDAAPATTNDPAQNENQVLFNNQLQNEIVTIVNPMFDTNDIFTNNTNRNTINVNNINENNASDQFNIEFKQNNDDNNELKNSKYEKNNQL
jgi:hypothetical protein